MTKRRGNKRSALISSTLLFALCVVCFIAALHTKLDARLTEPDPSGEAYSTLPSPQALEFMSLGHETFVADLLWLVALQHNHSVEKKLIPFYADAIIYLDPDFKAVYRWAATSMVFAGGKITAQGVIQANRYLDQGAARFPTDYYYPYTAGLNLAFYYPTNSKEKKRELIEEGVEYLQIAMQKPGVPRDTALLISGLLSSGSDREKQLEFLEQAYVSEPDPEVRRRIQSRVRSLAGADRKRVFEIRRVQREHWLDQNYGYVPPGIAFHLGSRSLFNPRTVLDPAP